MELPTSCRFTAVSDANHGAYDARYTPNGITTSVYNDGPRSRRTAPSHGLGTRYCLRALMSNASVIRPKNTMKYSPDHFVAQANPSSTPAPNRHHRTPSRGPHGVSPTRPSNSATCIRSRTRSRSTIRQPNAATTKTTRKPSNSAVRDATKLTPSQINNSPAIPPTNVDRLIRRPIRTTSSTRMMPHTAPLNRQPSPLYP